MEYALRHGLHYCAVGEQLIFLDLVADRYFGLGDRTATAFSQLAKGAEVDSDDLYALLRSGLVEWQADGALAACAALPIPSQSTIDHPFPRSSPLQRAAALIAITAVRYDLRRGRLNSAIDALRRLKETRRRPSESDGDLFGQAAAFAWTARWMRSHDQCLPRSLALARRLIAGGVDANLIIGIRLRPFAAHCWTQTREMIVNDRFEHVRSYQPILVV